MHERNFGERRGGVVAALLSKSLGFFVDPTVHWAILLIGLVVLAAFHLDGIFKVSLFLIFYFLTVVFSPLPRLMMGSLEGSYPVFTESSSKKTVVILTGGTVRFQNKFQQFFWRDSGDRVLVPLRKLAGENTVFYITGRSMETTSQQGTFSPEAQSMKSYAASFQPNIVLEEEARSTWENAENISNIFHREGIVDFYLVTSAFHMKRAMQSFSQFGLSPTPYPVDYRVLGHAIRPFSFSGTENVYLYKTALHEYIGLLYYWLLSFSR